MKNEAIKELKKNLKSRGFAKNVNWDSKELFEMITAAYNHEIDSWASRHVVVPKKDLEEFKNEEGFDNMSFYYGYLRGIESLSEGKPSKETVGVPEKKKKEAVSE